MNQNQITLLTTGVLLTALLIVVVAGALLYSGTKRELAQAREQVQQLQQQVDEKNRVINVKSGEITNLSGKNADLTSDLQAKETELSRRLGEVRKLQGSVKTVGRCLIGVTGAIDALQREDGQQARQSLFLMQATCRESLNIISQVEGFDGGSTGVNQ
jgi:uncharacterized protein YoxC